MLRYLNEAGVAAEIVDRNPVLGQLEDYARLAEIIVPASLPEPVSRETDDDLVLATALALPIWEREHSLP